MLFDFRHTIMNYLANDWEEYHSERLSESQGHRLKTLASIKEREVRP